MNKIYIAKELIKRIKNGKELMQQFPQNRAEYLDETLHYSRLLYELLKESVL